MVGEVTRGPRAAWAWLAALSLAWSALSARLSLDGVPARGVLLPIAPERYYAAQAVFVGPLLALLATVFASVAHRLARRADGEVTPGATWAALVPVYAATLLLGLVLPDALFHALGGRSAMTRAMRFYAPLVPLVLTAWATVRLRDLHGRSSARALGGVLAGLLAQLVLGAPWLR